MPNRSRMRSRSSRNSESEIATTDTRYLNSRRLRRKHQRFNVEIHPVDSSPFVLFPLQDIGEAPVVREMPEQNTVALGTLLQESHNADAVLETPLEPKAQAFGVGRGRATR